MSPKEHRAQALSYDYRIKVTVKENIYVIIRYINRQSCTAIIYVDMTDTLRECVR